MKSLTCKLGLVGTGLSKRRGEAAAPLLSSYIELSTNLAASDAVEAGFQVHTRLLASAEPSPLC